MQQPLQPSLAHFSSPEDLHRPALGPLSLMLSDCPLEKLAPWSPLAPTSSLPPYVSPICWFLCCAVDCLSLSLSLFFFFTFKCAVSPTASHAHIIALYQQSLIYPILWSQPEVCVCVHAHSCAYSTLASLRDGLEVQRHTKEVTHDCNSVASSGGEWGVRFRGRLSTGLGAVLG